MIGTVKCSIYRYLFLILFLHGSATEIGSLAATENDNIVDLMYELRSGITTGFQDQWRVLQKLRYQGIKRHQEFVSIFKEVQKLTQQLEEFKRQTNCSKQTNKQAITSTDSPPPNMATSQSLPFQPCPHLFEDANGECVFIGKERNSWDEANDICKSMGSFLYDGRNKTRHNLLRNYLKDKLGYSTKNKYLWVGGRYIDKEWKWVRRSREESNSGALQPKTRDQEESAPIDITTWVRSEPRTLSGVPLCMALDSTKDYQGVSGFCKYFKKFLCSV